MLCLIGGHQNPLSYDSVQTAKKRTLIIWKDYWQKRFNIFGWVLSNSIGSNKSVTSAFKNRMYTDGTGTTKSC